jgi:hypothetical protein
MAGKVTQPGQSTDVEPSPRWIRFEQYRRYHAVCAEQQGRYWTYCGMCVAGAGVRDEKSAPPARCACCRSRLKRPYLIPERLIQLRVRSN